MSESDSEYFFSRWKGLCLRMCFICLASRASSEPLKEHTSFKSLVRTRLKTKFYIYGSLHTSSVNEENFPVINSTGALPSGCQVSSSYGKLTTD